MIEFNDIASQWKEIRYSVYLNEFLSRGPYIFGSEVEAFEKEFAEYCGAKYAIGTSSGTDALKLAIQAIRGDIWSGPHQSPIEVFIPSNAHISSALAPSYFNLNTVLVDCDESHNIDIKDLTESAKRYTGKPKIVIVTHMYGNPADIPAIKKAFPENCFIIEDCSHAHGATINGQHVGTLGDIGVFSLYPTKNLGAFGDAGIIITNNIEYKFRLGGLRNYGAYYRDDCRDIGWNNRLDSIQALFLRKKLPRLKKWNSKKYGIAKLYNELLEGVGDLVLPKLTEGRVYHIYQIRTTRRDQLQKFLEKRYIPTLIHYSTPIHSTEQFYTPESFPRTETYSQEVLSLPIHPYLKIKDVKLITDAIKSFFNESCIKCGGHQELMEDNGKYICQWCARKIAGEKADIINPTGRYR